jgi:thioredoxin-related protein
MSVETFHDSEVKALIEKRFLFQELDVDKEQETAKWFGGKAIPETIILRSDGSVLHRVVGFVPPKEFLTRVRKYIDEK